MRGRLSRTTNCPTKLTMGNFRVFLIAISRLHNLIKNLIKVHENRPNVSPIEGREEAQIEKLNNWLRFEHPHKFTGESEKKSSWLKVFLQFRRLRSPTLSNELKSSAIFQLDRWLSTFTLNEIHSRRTWGTQRCRCVGGWQEENYNFSLSLDSLMSFFSPFVFISIFSQPKKKTIHI